MAPAVDSGILVFKLEAKGVGVLSGTELEKQL